MSDIQIYKTNDVTTQIVDDQLKQVFYEQEAA